MLNKRDERGSNRKILERKNASKMNLFPGNSQEFLTVSSRNNLFFLNTSKNSINLVSLESSSSKISIDL